MLAGQLPQAQPSWAGVAYFLCGICGAGIPMIAIVRYTLRQNILALWARPPLAFRRDHLAHPDYLGESLIQAEQARSSRIPLWA